MVRNSKLYLIDCKKAPSLFQKAEKSIHVTEEGIEDMETYTFWLPKEKGLEVYHKTGYSYTINTYKRCLEKISNETGGLDVVNYFQISQKEHGKREMIEESERIHQKIMMWAFDQEGNYDGTLDISSISEDVDTPKGDKTKKDGFIEYINTVTYLYQNNIPYLKIVNNRMDWNQTSDKNKQISNDEKLESYVRLASDIAKLKLTHLKAFKFAMKSYEWIYVSVDHTSE